MPATEQTWRNQRTLHAVFGASALVMAISTIWMMAADHNREWKDWQLKDRRKDAWMTQSRRDELADQYATRMNEYQAEIRNYDSQAIPEGVVEDFKQRVLDEDSELKRVQSEGLEAPPADDAGDDATVTPASFQAGEDAELNDSQFEDLNEAIEELAANAQAVAEAQSLVDQARTQVEQMKAALSTLENPPSPAEGEQSPAAAPARLEQEKAELQSKLQAQQESLDDAEENLRDAQDTAIASRRDALREFQKFINEARRRETALVARKKSLNGIRTAKVSELGIKIGQGADAQTTGAVQGEIDDLDRELTQLTADIASAKEYRTDLEATVARAEAPKALAAKELESMDTELKRLDEQVYQNTSNWGEWVTRWPVLNALYSGNIRIEQNWLPDMTINYNFSQAARFDRCTTCHRAVAKTAPGTATDPLYATIPSEDRDFTVQLITPETPPAEGTTLKQAYGMELSAAGIIADADVTVHYVLPESPAAKAGIQSGDVLREIVGNPMYSPEQASEQLLKLVPFGSAVEVSIRRGLDHPFTAHPRLDLYLTDTSPHPMKDVGCTICHDGQGSGTSFPWTSHTPDNAKQQNKWARDLGWFDNHHWIFPMKPARFAESNCLKCHHEKGSLEPSQRFPEPPAPKLVEGWTLVEEYGCFGCHEINGYDSPEVTVGPDVRLEPLYYEAASQMLRNESLNNEQRELALAVRNEPENDDARHQLLASFNKKPDDAEAAGEASATGSAESADQAKTDARDSADVQKLAALLKDVEIRGEYRKVGPSLRFLNSKVEYDWLYSWIRRPQDFRPSTKMPQFFLQYEHLSEEEDSTELAESQRFEPIEIRALTEYLLKASDKFEYEPPAEGVDQQPDAQRGKVVFETRGCLACHSHADFPEIKANQGPDLSRLSSKFYTEKGRQWLYSWVKEPNRYHVRTVMPDTFLDPIVERDAQNQPTGAVTDPAADVVEYLLSAESDWKPENVPARDQWSKEDREALADLATMWLTSDAVPESRARKYLEGSGFDESQRNKLKTDERLLIGLNDENRVERQLEFVARRTIGKYGCFGCHDIPGFEDAKPIGTALVDWGRKETSKLAFENIHKFLETHGIDPKNPTHDARAMVGDEQKEHVPAAGGTEHSVGGDTGVGDHAVAHGHLDPGDFDEKDSYYIQSINSHGRDGFLWQKLRYPRSYDYKTTRNKSFNERLRMPKFPFDAQQREAVMTFVLGLTKEPPASKYLYKPDPRQQAIVDGRQVLERFNCAGCHTLQQELWEFDYAGDTFEDASEVIDYPFLAPRFTDQQVAESLAKDHRGLQHAMLEGHPVYDDVTGEVGWVDQDRAPITPEELAEAEAEEGAEPIPVFYRFTLWENALVNGQPRLRGIDELLIPADREKYGPENGNAYPAWGGDLARYLFPRVIARAKETNPSVISREAWGWLPPPLMDEGKKVQTDWLHGFLMDPYAIRPATVMRMPNFHMSSREAAKLVDYFAAYSGAEFPYEYKPQQRSNYLTRLREQRENPLGEAMNIVTNGNYCVKCHAVADFEPQGDRNTFGPNLADVYRRLRPEFMRDWIANPARILPYTGMPVNIPYRPDDPEFLGGVAQELYHGTSVEQLSGVVDLLMNFDAYARGNTSVTPLVQQAAQAAAAQQQGAGEGAAAPGQNAQPPNASAAEGTGEPTQ